MQSDPPENLRVIGIHAKNPSRRLPNHSIGFRKKLIQRLSLSKPLTKLCCFGLQDGVLHFLHAPGIGIDFMQNFPQFFQSAAITNIIHLLQFQFIQILTAVQKKYISILCVLQIQRRLSP